MKKPKKKKPAAPKSNVASKSNISSLAEAKEKRRKPGTFMPSAPGKKLVLHVGCGDKAKGSRLHASFKTPEWEEVRLDIVPDVEPDIVADMRDMHMIAGGQFDALWSSHNIEHVYPHEVTAALKEFRRVLKDNGHALIATPDLQTVMEAAVKKGIDGTLYTSPVGPIAPLDVFYGHRGSLARGALYMAHKTGFSAKLLGQMMKEAGFRDIRVQRNGFNLLAIGYRRALSSKENERIKIIEPDINEITEKRDAIEKQPENWPGLPFGKAGSQGKS